MTPFFFQMHLLPNSSWKDYSTANTNYAFDAFEVEEKANGQQPPAKPRRPSNPVASTDTTDYAPHREKVHAATLMAGGMYPYRNDTRSLQRPRTTMGKQYHPYERSTYSLPRHPQQQQQMQQQHVAHVRDRSDLVQPDFYFMPSQRKYSGEVVRVYVDYNNK